MVSDTAFIFHIYIPLGKALSIEKKSQGHLSRSRSNIKVTDFEKMAFTGALVFHKHSLFISFSFYKTYNHSNIFTQNLGPERC